METKFYDIVNESFDKGNKQFIVTYNDGRCEKKRLFPYVDAYAGKMICEYKSGCSRRGFALYTGNIVDITPVSKTITDASRVKQARRFFTKAVGLMNKSGLWSNIKSEFEKALLLTDEELLEILVCKDWDRKVEIEKKYGIHFGIDSISYTISKGIKSINYFSWEKEITCDGFRKAIEEKRKYSYSWHKGYDNRISCAYNEEDGIMRGWYDEEYKGCGNGHYWLAIDESHAIFAEDD